MNLREIKEILELMDRHELTEFEFEKNGVKVKLSKSPTGQVTVTPQAFSGQLAPAPIGALAEGSQPAATAVEDQNIYIVRSPMVGTFYASPAPDKEPFIHKGKDVKSEDVLCIIEAMKLMNEIKSEVSGKVVEVIVSNGEPVEFDQPLFKIQKF